MPDIFARIEAAAAASVGDRRPSATKRGGNPRYPYVPVIVRRDGGTEQVRGFAYASRAEAIACAQATIEAKRVHARTVLLSPLGRGLRQQHGLPVE